MREVLISIQPKWVSPITLGKKTVECRKNKPNCEVPFKCYIYCSAKDYDEVFGVDKFMHKVFLNGGGKQKVIGEFVCDRIYNLDYLPKEYYGTPSGTFEQFVCEHSCLSFEDIKAYRNGKCVYGWRISDLKIYDKPRELSEFYAVEKKSCPAYLNGTCLDRTQNQVIRCENLDCEHKKITRSPQSWQFCVATEPRQTAD